MTRLIISNQGIKDIIKIVKSLEQCSLLTKGVTETVYNLAKEQERGFLSILLRTLLHITRCYFIRKSVNW